MVRNGFRLSGNEGDNIQTKDRKMENITAKKYQALNAKTVHHIESQTTDQIIRFVVIIISKNAARLITDIYN